MNTKRFTVLIQHHGKLFCVHTRRFTPADAALAATVHTNTEHAQIVAVLSDWCDVEHPAGWQGPCGGVTTTTTQNV